MTKWSYYDDAGEPAREKNATFKAKAVAVDLGTAAPSSATSLARYEYHDVHHVDQPELRKTFKSFATMTKWFAEYAQLKAKGKAR